MRVARRDRGGQLYERLLEPADVRLEGNRIDRFNLRCSSVVVVRESTLERSSRCSGVRAMSCRRVTRAQSRNLD